MNFPGLYDVVKETEEDGSAISSSVFTSSSEETDDSDWSDNLKEVKIELSTEEMSTSSKGTVGWFHRRHIIKPKRKHAEAKRISARDKETVKGKPKRKHAAKSENTLEANSVSVNGKEAVKAKRERKNSPNRSVSSIIKADKKAKDHQSTAKKTSGWSSFIHRGATTTVAPNARFLADVENDDAISSEPPPRNRLFKFVSAQMHQRCLPRA
jgi:hypothetical protein